MYDGEFFIQTLKTSVYKKNSSWKEKIFIINKSGCGSLALKRKRMTI